MVRRKAQLKAVGRKKSSFSQSVFPGIVTPLRPVPKEIARPPYVPGVISLPRTPLALEEKNERMRAAGVDAREIMLAVGPHVKPGVTTEELDVIVHEKTIELGGYPSPLQYHGFPKSVCTSVNEVICHGIPDSRKLVEVDRCNIVVTIFLYGVLGAHISAFEF